MVNYYSQKAAIIARVILINCGFFVFCTFFENQLFAKVEISIHNDFSRKSRILVAGLDENNFLIRRDAEFLRYKIFGLLNSTGLFELSLESEFNKALSLQSNRSEFSAAESILSPNNSNYYQNSQITSSPYNLKRELAIGEVPNFEIYRKEQIDNLAIFAISANSVGNIEVHLKLWDVNDRKEIANFSTISTRLNVGEAAKDIANQIYVSLTGENKGHFKEQIAYVAETGSIRKRIKKLCLIEIDGSNRRCLTDGNEIVLTPTFSKSSNKIYFVRYFRGQPQIFVTEERYFRPKKIGGYRETTMAPSPNPLNPNILLLSVINEGDSDIHLLDLDNNFSKKITNSPAIETTASFSPDGKSIIFTSDRKAGQQIYRMNLDGSDIVKVSRGGGTYAKPQFSPDGRFIAFTKIFGDKFFIGTMKSDGSDEKLLVSDYVVEGGRWSNNGRYLIYSKKIAPFGKGSIPRLWIVDVVTGHEYQVPTPSNEGAVDPDWSWY